MNISQGFNTFPPAFHNNGFAYSFALFALLILASVSLAQIVRTARCLEPSRNGWNSPVSVARLIVSCLYAVIFLGTFPDVVVLLLWNEVTDPVMQDIWAADRVFDGLTLVPFVAAIYLSLRAESKITGQLLYTVGQVLGNDKPVVDLRINFLLLRPQIKLAILAAFIAAGISLGKWTGAV